MKKGIELYGIVIAAVILLTMLLVYFFSKGGFMGKISETPPSSELDSVDESALLEDVGGREKPTVSVTIKELKGGKTYDLLKEFSMTAINAQGQELPVQIEEVTYEDGTVMDTKRFTPQEAGIYKMVVSAREEYRSFVLETKEAYEFMVD